jgi:hypothetical protein
MRMDIQDFKKFLKKHNYFNYLEPGQWFIPFPNHVVGCCKECGYIYANDIDESIMVSHEYVYGYICSTCIEDKNSISSDQLELIHDRLVSLNTSTTMTNIIVGWGSNKELDSMLYSIKGPELEHSILKIRSLIIGKHDDSDIQNEVDNLIRIYHNTSTKCFPASYTLKCGKRSS